MWTLSDYLVEILLNFFREEGEKEEQDSQQNEDDMIEGMYNISFINLSYKIFIRNLNQIRCQYFKL